ncbi:hypothetical protein K461DRAFT_293527 [Myriangium duriaei CBS 260.36]|uniref:Uncharacterized protein n=1 Tax=Myriangium duriaei CBS 260.36 TaxID=1168546 RepID=A0A9P4MHK2_9PEZI|nr:hypothetical protein K461DRAFT_293527 [Myriangium duriaei CBS 260.36]
MPRSASDATRFTATGPSATAKPSSSASSISIGQSAPANETPQQKIARLRAAAARAKLGKESQFDKVVRVGRVWADRAHRTTAWGLIGLTVVCGVFATFAIGDMLIHNRRKRKEWLEEQQQKSSVALEEARTAAARGTANEDQILLLNRERAAAEAETERKAKTGILSKARDAMFSGASDVEEKGGKIMSEVRSAQEQRTKSAQPSGFLEDVNSGVEKAVTKTKESVKSNIEFVKGGVVGGPLDRQAAATANAISQQTKSWFSWGSGR